MTAVSRPSASEIAKRQNTEANRRRQLAARTVYKRGKWVHLAGVSLAIVFALASPIVLYESPDLGPALGAAAGLWIFVSRLVLEPWRLGLQRRGAQLQETFDCDVLGLEENLALGRRVSEEEVKRASRKLESALTIGDWYPFPEACTWPTSVLVCQRSNAVWARRQHRAYAWVLYGGTTVWGVVGVVLCVTHHATLAEYLTTIAMPSLPAMLDAVEMAGRHVQAARARQLLEGRTDELLDDVGAVELTDLREVQDQLYGLRATAPLVPEWFYKALRSRFEGDMQYAATEVARGVGRGK